MIKPDPFPQDSAFVPPGDDRAPAAQDAIAFRDFRVWPTSRLLLRSGEVICVGSRAFDLLVVLLNCRGTVVDKAELLKRVWPSTIVDESNLRFQIATLRNVLGPDRDLVKSVPGRGYFFAFDPQTDALPAREREEAAQDGKTEAPAPPRHDAAEDATLQIAMNETALHKDHVVDLFMHFAQQLVAYYGSVETARKALSSLNG